MTPVWTRRIADEFWSGPVTPLTYSLLAEPMAEHMVRRALRQAGLAALADAPVLRRHASHVYVNGDLLGAVLSLLPSFVRSKGLLQLLPPAAQSRVAPASTVGATLRALAIVVRFARAEPAWSPWQRARAFERACAATRARFTGAPPPAPDAQPAALLAELRGAQDALGSYLETVSWGVVFAYVSYHLLHELCRRWAPGCDADVPILTIGLPGVASLDAARDVAALGARLDRTTVAALDGADARDGPALLCAGGGAAAVALRTVLAAHGHRLVGRDLACPTWREAPDVVLRLARRAVEAHGAPTPAAATRRMAATARVEAAIAGGASGVVRLPVFRAALAAAQRYYVVRENMRYYADFFLARMRAIALALGTRLRLASPHDVFFVDLDELTRACGGGASVDDRIAIRRREFAADTADPPPLVLFDEESVARVPAPPPSPAAASLTLTGECASPGRCRGRARVVRDAGDFADFAAGDIMVAAYTDPAWTPILELASGLILDAGGQLSHGAIVARELGIPALVNVADATRAIRTGDVLDLDASAAVVRREPTG